MGRRVPHSADRGATLIAKSSHSPLYPRRAPTDDAKNLEKSHSAAADVRGMGTSSALSEPCNNCEACLGIANGTFLDLIEIDAASNRGIDDVRELREKVNFQPAVGRKKVYILDEVHMLTKEAFNALLKTLEEPPEHAMFILCTTEPYKVPDTITSRCQRFDFQLSDVGTLQSYVLQIAGEEKIELDDGAAALIARSAAGAYRDAIGLLEQVISYRVKSREKKEKIKIEDVKKVLGLPAQEQIEELLTKIVQKHTQNLLKFVDELYVNGINLHQFIKETIVFLRRELLLGLEGKETETKLLQDEIVSLITLLNKAEQEMKFAVVPQLPLELALLEFVGDAAPPSASGKCGSVPSASGGSGLVVDVEKQPPQLPQATRQPAGSATTRSPQAAATTTTTVNKLWPQVLAAVKPKNHTIEAFLKGCRPESLKNDILTLQFFYPFHREKIEEARNRKIVEEAATEVLGRKTRVRCVLSSKPKAKTQTAETSVSAEISEEEMKKIAEEIFGDNL